MDEPLTSSERFVLEMCRKSCLRFWCYNNPSLEGGKELTDALVVFGDHILIISVKEISLKVPSEESTESEILAYHSRWNRKAVEDSVRQVYGAEKSLSRMSEVLNKRGEAVAPLPPAANRIVHRLAVAFGSRGETTIASKDYGKGFVHVMNETSFYRIWSELDTISELLEYLTAKEVLVQNASIVIEGDESNLLAYYLANARSFPEKSEVFQVLSDNWYNLQTNPTFQHRKREDAPSVWWDRLIDFAGSASSTDTDGNPLKKTDKDLALRIMAQERRFERRALASAAKEFLELGASSRLNSRIMKSPSTNSAYLLRFFREGQSNPEMISDILLRSHLVPSKASGVRTVVGLGFSQQPHETGFALTLTYLPVSELTPEDIRRAEEVATELKLFSKLEYSHRTIQEYPNP